MVGLFSRLKGRDGSKKKKNAPTATDAPAAKPFWDDAYTRTTVEPEEIHDLLRCCTQELKARALDIPFLLLPFRPTSDPSAVRTFIRHFFGHGQQPTPRGEALVQELRMTEPMVIAGVVKWCWTRLQGGVVGWDAYELFKVGEYDSNMARDSFKTFIPISVENGARQRIIFDFFDLLAAVAAHGKSNGLGGRKLSRMAAWWAFEHKNTDKGFEGGYNAWLSAADATSHLFFAYLRSLSPEQNVTGISMLPMSLQKLVQDTEYPPQRPELLITPTNRVLMVVDTVSPTPFALLRRANHFQYRDSDRALQEYSEYEDPVEALTEECRRVLKSVSAANQSQVSSSKHSTGLRDASWSRFEDIGFSSALEEEDDGTDSALATKPQSPGLLTNSQSAGLMTTSQSETHLGRPTTPSWADFLSSGFAEDAQPRTNMLLPPDKVLPPIDVQARGQSSQSHRPRLESDSQLEPGELASITIVNLDDAFWWVWMSSLAPEETGERKSAFGRCAVIETKIRSGRWLVMEEMVAGAAPDAQEGAYVAEKKGFFSWTKRNKGVSRRKSTHAGNKTLERDGKDDTHAMSKTSIGPDTHAKIQAKAAQLRAAEGRENQLRSQAVQRRGRPNTEIMNEKTNSVLTLQPSILGEASSAMKWTKAYDKGTIKDAYLANSNAGRGFAISPSLTDVANGVATTSSRGNQKQSDEQDTGPALPAKDSGHLPAAEDVAPAQPAEPAPVVQDPGVHPLHREQPGPAEDSPVPPPKEEAVPESAASEPLDRTASTSEKKRGKLSKDPKEKTGGLRGLFSRKNRTSKMPENAAADVNTMLTQDEIAKEPVQQQEQQPEAPQPQEQPAPVQNEVSAASSMTSAITDMSEVPNHDSVSPPGSAHSSTPAPAAQPAVQSKHDAQPRNHNHDPRDKLAKISSRDQAEANREFSRFDQGPLDDQPAFVPDQKEEESEEDSTPPPISRHPRSTERLNKNLNPPAPVERLSQTAGPGVQDRWAQIRKNAAERAARGQTEEPSYTSNRVSVADNDDDTSGEETIESRVARIKARVAELTGNMEGSSSPSLHAQQGIPRR